MAHALRKTIGKVIQPTRNLFQMQTSGTPAEYRIYVDTAKAFGWPILPYAEWANS